MTGLKTFIVSLMVASASSVFAQSTVKGEWFNGCDEAQKVLGWKKCVADPRLFQCKEARDAVATCGGSSAGVSNPPSPPSGNRGNLLSFHNFENGLDYSQLKVIGSSNVPTITRGFACSGKSAARMELNAKAKIRPYRTEVKMTTGGGNNRRFTFRKDYWFGSALYLPSDGNWTQTDNSNPTLTQFHGRPDSGEVWRQPIIAFSRKSDGNFNLHVRADSKRITVNKKYSTNKTFSLGKMPIGKWIEMVWHVRFDPRGNGIVELWIDGRKRVSFRGEVGYNDDLPPDVSFGNYTSSWRPSNCSGSECRSWAGPDKVTRRHHFIDDIRIAENGGSYRDVVPICD